MPVQVCTFYNIEQIFYIKMENIIIKYYKNIKKIFYMSPELLEKNYNEKCDIWAVAVMIFEMITQHVPCKGSTIDDVYN